MGIIIIFVIGISIGIVFTLLIRLVELFRKKDISKKIILQGFFLSIFLHFIIFLTFIIKGKFWAFAPIFRQAFWLIIIPSFLYIVLEFIKNGNAKYLSRVILISIIISTLIAIGSFNYYFDLLIFFGAEKHY